MMVRPLVCVYEAAVYEVLGGDGFVMRVGRYSAELADLYERRGCCSAAFLTAYNPGSVKYTDTANEAAQHELEILLKQQGISFLTAIGKDPDPTSEWKDEKSVLALGLTNSQAVEIAAKFKQAAILRCPQSAIPELQMLEDSRNR